MSLSCEVDPVAHIRLDTAPNTPSLATCASLEYVRDVLREETITPLCNTILPKIRFPWITHTSLSCEVDPVAHIRLDTAPNTLSLFTDSVPDDYATELLLAHTKRV